jgi:phosphoglucosamine mutase
VDGKFTGKKIIIDCANGASFYVAPEVWKRLGAEVTAINTRYDGTNINLHCGSTHPEGLQEAVVANGADFGIAHDGDADRVIMVDHLGREVDGDKILYICGSYLLEEGRLPGNTIVGTVMSNLGLDLAFRKKGGCVEKTKVGDRYVLERMLEKGYVLGGEQSGHVIFTEYGTTGDGLLTALQTANVLEKKKASLAELADEVQTVPQKLVNVRVKDKSRLSDNPVIAAAIAKGEKELGDMGRILVRPSGTEPLIRVMVEALDHEQLDRILDAVVQAVENELG